MWQWKVRIRGDGKKSAEAAALTVLHNTALHNTATASQVSGCQTLGPVTHSVAWERKK